MCRVGHKYWGINIPRVIFNKWEIGVDKHCIYSLCSGIVVRYVP